MLGLQCRSTLWVVGLTLGMASLVGWLFLEIGGTLTGRLQRSECRQLAALLAHAGSDSMACGDVESLGRLARQFIAGDSLLSVQFFDPSGSVVAHAASESYSQSIGHGDSVLIVAGGTLGTPQFVPGRPGVEPHLDVTLPVNKQHPAATGFEADAAAEAAPRRELLGYVRLALNVHQPIKELASALDLVSGLAIFVVILTVPLGFLIVRGIVEPVNDLAASMENFAAGDLSARSRVRRRDEIGKLARAFNHMADLHERNHEQLVALNAELEERVRQRTMQLHDLAVRDPLTGLYNRRHFNDVLARRHNEARRYGTPLSCLMLDLDDFKRINDSSGHPVGDEVLVMTAETIVEQLRASDVAARFGGDEFVVLLPQTTIRRAEMLSARISEALATAVQEKLPRTRVSVSIGVSSLEEADSDDPDDLVRAADQALYAAKSDGKDRIVTAAPVAV